MAIRGGGVSMRRVRGALEEILSERDPGRAKGRAREILPDLAELARRLVRVRELDPDLAAVGFGRAVERVLELSGQDPGAWGLHPAGGR